MATERFALAVFCDDLRMEIGNKVTLVGIYNGDMFLSEFPAFIPKLAVWLVANTPTEQPFSKVEFRVSKGDEELFRAESTTAPMALHRSAEHDAPTWSSLRINIGLGPMTIAGPCTLRAVFSADGIEYVAGKLHIGLVPKLPGSEEVGDLGAA